MHSPPTSAPEIQASGVSSLRGVTRALTARGVRTARGGDWTAVQVSDILRRYPVVAAVRGPGHLFRPAHSAGFRGQGLGMGNADWQYDHRLDPLGPCRCWRLALVRQPPEVTEQRSDGGNGGTRCSRNG